MKTLTSLGIAATVAMMVPGIASASYVLDSGTPTTPTGSPVTILSTSQFVAAEFNVASLGVDISQLAVYLTQGTGSVNDTFTIDIYSAGSTFTGRSTGRILDYSTTGTFTANGWNTVTTNWTPTATGLYWVALQVSSTTQTKGLDLPGAGISLSTGTASALGFAVAGTNGQYVVESATAPTTPFGIQLSATAVPLPAAGWLLLSSLGALGTAIRRRRA